MNEIIMIVFAASLYALLVLLWKGRKKLKKIDKFRGAIGLSYTAILGIIGATIFMLQEKLLVRFDFTPKLSIALSIGIMFFICIPLYMFFVKGRKLE